MCYYAEFGRSALKGVCIDRRTPKSGTAASPLELSLGIGGVAADDRKIHAPPYLLPLLPRQIW